MNQNDTDRYYWRTGHPWSGDCRWVKWTRPKFTSRTMHLLALTFALTTVALILYR
jgi:hypothetical protein